MLVLTRKANQRIEIGDNIVITVLQVKGNSVRLGIEAPRDVRVIRGELPRNAEPAAVETVEAEMHDAAEMVLPAADAPEAVQVVTARGRSTSLRQAPADAGRNREVRSSPLLRFIAAGAATDAPGEWPSRPTFDRALSTIGRAV
jgi:carbon storage regulator CsrA